MRTPRKWTAERDAVLRAEYADCTDNAALLAKVNALPGQPITSADALGMHAWKIGLRKSPEAISAMLAAAAERICRHNSPDGNRRTPEREALMRAEYPGFAGGREAFLSLINALPGPPLRSHGIVRQWAAELGLRKTDEAHRAIRRHAALANRPNRRKPGESPPPKPRAPKPYVAPPAPEMRCERPLPPVAPVIGPAPMPAVVPCAALADQAVNRKHDMARQMIRSKRDAAVIASRCALPLREVFRLQGEMRMERGA